MLHRRIAILTILVTLLVGAPAAASERSEARRYAAAMTPLALEPDEAEALIADYEARSALVVATCLPSVQAAAVDDVRRLQLAMLYGLYAARATYERYVPWLRAGDRRLAGIRTRSRVLRRARAARRGYTRFLAGVIDIAPADFCAMVTNWETGGFARELAEHRRVVRLLLRVTPAGAVWDGLVAIRRLGRHGATPAQRDAFAGTVRWPAVRAPAEDPVVELLGDALLPERASGARAG